MKNDKTRIRLTLYRDDSTAQVGYDNVKHWFWTANNTVLVIAQITNDATGAHRYIHWPRERFCWFKDERYTSDAPPPSEAPADDVTTYIAEATGEVTPLLFGTTAARFNVYDTEADYSMRRNGINTMTLETVLKNPKPGAHYQITITRIGPLEELTP